MAKFEKPTAEVMQELFAQYRINKDVTLRNEIVMSYSYIAKAVAGQMRGVASSYAQMEDIVNQGIITLIECVDRFDESKNVKFEAYAFMRVKHSIIDYLRQQDFLPRRLRQSAKEVREAENELGNRLMREPTITEVAEHMKITDSQLTKIYAEISKASLISLDELYHKDKEDMHDIPDDSSGQLDSGLFREEQRAELIAAIETLNDRERTIISLYYFERLKLTEIAKVLTVSESRISQLHVRALHKLRAKLEENNI